MSKGFVLDTNIILYSIGGDVRLTRTLGEEDLFISAMARMEALAYHGDDPGHLSKVRAFINECEVIEIERIIQDIAVDLRVEFNVKFPDAIIAATAIVLERPLFTADKALSRINTRVEVVLYDHT